MRDPVPTIAGVLLLVLVSYAAMHAGGPMPRSEVAPLPGEETVATRGLVERLFGAFAAGDSKPLFDHVADDVQWTVRGTNAPSGKYRGKREFLDATCTRPAAVLKQPVRPTVRRIVADGDVAVVEWHCRATSVSGEPSDNDYCWVIRVRGDQIIEVRAYFNGGPVDRLFVGTEKGTPPKSETRGSRGDL
jgi:ketosteroid isomerase-like protein